MTEPRHSPLQGKVQSSPRRRRSRILSTNDELFRLAEKTLLASRRWQDARLVARAIEEATDKAQQGETRSIVHIEDEEARVRVAATLEREHGFSVEIKDDLRCLYITLVQPPSPLVLSDD